MSLTTSAITGRVPLPNNAVPNSVEVIFTLNGMDTEGINTLPPESSVRFQLTTAGEFPAGAQLWRNLAGLRGTSYRVEIRWTESVNGRETLREAFAGYVQIGNEAAYTLADLLASPAGADPAVYVNVPQSKWQEFNDRLDYMYSIAESSLPATVERAVEAELAAKASEQAAAASAQAAAGSAVQAVADVNVARDGALTAIGTAEGESVTAVETARDDAIALIDPKVQQADTAAETATTKAGEASTSAEAAATSESNANTSAGNADASAQAAAASASNAYGSELVAASSAASAAGALASVEAASGAAATSAQEALDSEVAARSSEVAAAGSAGAAAASAGTADSARAAALSSASAAALSAGSANDAFISTKGMMDEFANFRFLGKVEWWVGSPSMIPSGFLPMNGQIGNRSDYPDIWEDISNGVFISVTDTLWLNGPNADSKHRHRASFSTGNGTTTFRFPDLNGVQTDSLKGLFLRGGQNADSLTNGQVFRDAIRNITGNIGWIQSTSGAAVGTGAIFWGAVGAGGNMGEALNPDATARGGVTLDAARVVPTASENRPVSAVGTWIMLVNGAPARQFNPETGAGLGSNTFGGLQKFNAGFEFTGVVPQLVQTDVDQGLTTAQKLTAATNAGAVSYASPQTLTSAEKLIALQNISGVPYADDLSTIITAAQKQIARKNIGLGTPADFAVQSQAVGVSSATSGQHTRYHMDFRLHNGSGGEIWRIIFGSFVKPASASDSISLTYGFTFLNGGSYIMLNNGDGQVDGSIILSPFNVTLSGFACAARLGGAQYLGVYRGNYSVLGRLS